MIELNVLSGDVVDLNVNDNSPTALEVNMATSGGGGGQLSDDVKQALLQIAENVAYINDQGQVYYDDLYNALYPLVSIQAVYTQSGTVYDTDSLDSLKSDLVVTAVHSGGTMETVTAYTLSGSLVEGTSTITVSYGGKTTTFNVTVTHALVLESISAVYTQSGTVYDTDSLDSLKADLVVTATYSDSSTATIPSTDYTLSGTLTEGTSTITVSFSGETTTFSATVTFGFLYTPSKGLLSAQSYVSSVTSPENVSESLENGYLKLSLQAKSADNQTTSFNFTKLAGNSFHIRAKVMAVSMGSNSNKWNQGPFRFSVVNGSVWSTSGLNNNNGYRVRYVKSNWECGDSSFTFAANTWVTLDVVLSNGTVTIKLDDAMVVSNLVLPTNSATVTRLDVQRLNSACEFLVDSIEFTR